MSQLLSTINRTHCVQFSLELHSSKEIVPVKTVDSEVCGLLRVMGTLFLGTDAAVEVFKNNFLICYKQNSIYLSIIWGRHNSFTWISRNFCTKVMVSTVFTARYHEWKICFFF